GPVELNRTQGLETVLGPCYLGLNLRVRLGQLASRQRRRGSARPTCSTALQPTETPARAGRPAARHAGPQRRPEGARRPDPPLPRGRVGRGDGRAPRLRHEDDRQCPAAREAQGALTPAVAPSPAVGRATLTRRRSSSAGRASAL